MEAYLLIHLLEIEVFMTPYWAVNYDSSYPYWVNKIDTVGSGIGWLYSVRDELGDQTPGPYAFDNILQPLTYIIIQNAGIGSYIWLEYEWKNVGVQTPCTNHPEYNEYEGYRDSTYFYDWRVDWASADGSAAPLGVLLQKQT